MPTVILKDVTDTDLSRGEDMIGDILRKKVSNSLLISRVKSDDMNESAGLSIPFPAKTFSLPTHAVTFEYL